MGLLDTIAFGLFFVLLYRLKNNYMNRGKKGREGDKKGMAAGETSANKNGNEGSLLDMENGQNLATVAVFVALVAMLVMPMIFGSGSGRSGGRVDPREVVVVYLDPVNVHVASKTAIRASERPYVVGLVDMSLNDAPESFDEMKEMCELFLQAVTKGKVVDGIALGTVNNMAYYKAENLGMDVAVIPFRDSVKIFSVHGFGTKGAESEVTLITDDCLGEATLCSPIVEEGSTNQKIRASMLDYFAEQGQGNCECECNENAEPKVEPVIIKAQQQQQQEAKQYQQQQRRERIVEDDTSYELERTATYEGPGIVKLLVLWITRLLGFIYPIIDTYNSLLRKDETAQTQWRAYWTIFAFINFLEDMLFIHLVYLMPIYIIAKLVLMAWCIWPNPSNSIIVYNQMVFAVKESRKVVYKLFNMPLPREEDES